MSTSDLEGPLGDFIQRAHEDALERDLRERNSLYGKFTDNSGVSQAIKHALRNGLTWQDLPHWKKEALELIAMKMGRIVSGDCGRQADSWYDIAGYAKLGSEDHY